VCRRYEFTHCASDGRFNTGGHLDGSLAGNLFAAGREQLFADYALAEFTVRRFRDSSEHFIVSENDDGLDGFIRLSSGRAAPVADCSSLEISTLYVQPRHHGRGVGKRLLERGLAYAQALRAPSVWLTTNSGNTPAFAFYLKQGFEKAGTTHFHIQDQACRNTVLKRVIGAHR
jgi:ribosomal protein S18 acetylase RimI-like enzyme